MKSIITILFVLVALQAGSAAAEDDIFAKTWYDGNAEIDAYKLKIKRYGEERDGNAVLIYVTEPFNSTRRVKADSDGPDVFTALKLNMVRDFQTGVYDYNTMSSVFVHADDFRISKQSFSSAEWCGHVYEELLFYDEDVKGHYYSYFDQESGEIEDSWRKGGFTEESLWILLRGLRGEFMEPGKTRDYMMLPSALWRRLTHTEYGWVGARITRSKANETITVPAGQFEVTVYTLQAFDGRKGQFHIEADYPHRIIRWSMDPDVSAELTGSQRMAYWKLHGNGDEAALDELGLKPISK